MTFPLALWDISLLLAITAIILLITSELHSSYYGRTNIYINKKRLRNAALTVSLLFIATVAAKIISIVLTP